MRKSFFVGLFVLSGIVLSPLQSLAAKPVYYYLLGEDRSVFLGCTNCGEYDNDSLENDFGTYGSPYNPMSIRNNYGVYGSTYSDTSACNPNANNPPVLADTNGNIHGYVTVNRRFNGNIAAHPRLFRACQ